MRDAVVRQYVELNRTAISNTHFSLHIDGADLSRAPLVVSADVVHLHWTASFQTAADVRALFDAKPVVWTLHDLEPLTGGCHFPAGCEGYVDGCAGCPQLMRDPFQVTATTLRDKKTLWARARPTFIAPSRYMAERARHSAVAQNAEASIVHIPNGIDVEAFHPRSKEDARRALGLPVDGLYVLCGSNYNAEKRKGLGLLNRVLAAATAHSRHDHSTLKLLTVGEPKLDFQDLDGIDVIQLGRASVHVMPTVYAAADLFVHPAVEDNFPLMLLESLSCGTPAIAFDVGGVADILLDERCGRLVAAGDEAAMAAALSSLVREPHVLRRMGESARAHVEQHFSDASAARKHAELYDGVVENRAAPRAPSGSPQKTGIDEIFPRLSTACLIDELALARERAVLLLEGSRSRSQRIAALEREAAERALHLEDQTRQVEEKEAELITVHQVAEERGSLTRQLHASAATIEAIAVSLRTEVEGRDNLLAQLGATIDEQRAEIEMVHRVAAERQLLIDDVHRAASERSAALERDAAGLAQASADRARQVREKEAELTAIYEVAEERKALAEQLHTSAASIEALAASLQNEVRGRDELLAELAATIDEQRAEIELVHGVAAERQRLIEREAARLAQSAADQSRHIQAKEAELTAIHAVAEERKVLAERLHASAASIEALAASLQTQVRERDDLLAKLEATIGEQGTEIELIHRVAAERAALIDRLSAFAAASQ